MSGPGSASLTACPNGHASADRALCSVCGVPLQPWPGTTGSRGTGPSIPSTPSMPSTQIPDPGPPADDRDACPHCTAPVAPGSRFCEVCGYDPATGSLPHVHAPEVRPAAPPPAAPSRPPGPGTLVAVITADRPYYDGNEISEVAFPVGVPPRVIELRPGAVSIGRRSHSRGTNPVVDLAGPPEDPAVSHTHASLIPGDDGTWALVDHGSTNGTYLNESAQPVPANSPRPVGPGDRIYVGAWTKITLELPGHA